MPTPGPSGPAALLPAPRSLRRPAAWCLALGSLTVLALAVRAGNAPGLAAVWAATPTTLDPAPSDVLDLEQWSTWATAFSIVVAGGFACTWLVRLQAAALRAGLLERYAPDSGLLLMWVLPLVNVVVPLVRLRRLDRVLHGTRASWTTYAWAAAWAPTVLVPWPARSAGGDPRPVPGGLGVVVEAWLHLGCALVALVLWATVVVRLTRAGERVAGRAAEAPVGPGSQPPRYHPATP